MEVCEHERLVRDYYQAIDEGSLERALAPFAEDCVYDRQGRLPMQGRGDIEVFYRSDRVIESGEHRLDHLLCDEEWVTVRGTFVGTLRTGEHVDLAFTDWFRIRGQQIVYRQSLFPARAV